MGILTKLKNIFKKDNSNIDEIQTTFNRDNLEDLIEEGVVENVQD